MNKKAIKLLILWSYFSLLPGITFGQACCSGGTPLAGSLGLQSMPSGSGLVEINYDYNTQHDLVAGSKRLDDNPRRRNTHSLLLRSVYAFNDRTALFTIFSFVQQEEVTQQTNGDKRLLKATGLGDAIAFGQYALLDHLGKQLLLGGGVKFPIGSVTEIDPETGLPLHPDLQPGTGSWDFLLGSRFGWQAIFMDNLNFMTHLTFRMTTPADRYTGRQKYEFGDELRWLSGFSANFGGGTGIWTPSLLFLYRFTQVDRTNDFETPNTGGHWLHLRPGLGFSFHPDWNINIFGEWPLYRQLNGIQLTTSTRIRLSLSYHFSKSSSEMLMLTK